MTTIPPIDADRLWVLARLEQIRRLTRPRRTKGLDVLRRAFEAREFTTAEVAANEGFGTALGGPAGDVGRATDALSDIRRAGPREGRRLVKLTGHKPARWQVVEA
jgi:hypothetical protein